MFLHLLEHSFFFLLGNLHKWLFAPRGCAILWVSPKFHDIIVPLVVSWMHDRSLQDRFYSQGTIDHSAYISAGAAIKFYSEVGGMVSAFSFQILSTFTCKVCRTF